MRIFTENRKASFNYEILEKFEAGIVLLGTEVKSIKLGRASLVGSYVVARGDEFCLVGGHIPAYQPKNAPAGYLPEKDRKLLLRKKELSYLRGRISQKGLTFVPLRLYTNDEKIKLEFALAKPIKRIDRREVVRKRDVKREIKEVLG
ncbi:MAG: SsrA-binding protein [Candidatus Wildermuthbacteria bacterium GWA2_46_15]|uniref:SsrA-binding protein n=1 Tax=Candidatus Wildermuthbacteria bacterium GWA2_46_15 TaxID=1802443 RepID=A0A1G2QM27_9BACT|nr:MAG: SsrA-binding protein [Candidatus Wildermuthbacteria bacterium GWA2_46_15]